MQYVSVPQRRPRKSIFLIAQPFSHRSSTRPRKQRPPSLLLVCLPPPYSAHENAKLDPQIPISSFLVKHAVDSWPDVTLSLGSVTPEPNPCIPRLRKAIGFGWSILSLTDSATAVTQRGKLQRDSGDFPTRYFGGRIASPDKTKNSFYSWSCDLALSASFSTM